MAEPENPADVTAMTVQLLSAYLTNNTVASENLAELIRTTRAALTQDASEVVPAEEPEVHTPAVSVRKSLSSPEYLISLIDGKRYKTLKRHLAGHGLTPDTYRERYGLPASYPMVAPAFAEMRRETAGRIGLGRRRPADAAPSVAQTTAESPDDAVKVTDSVAAAAPASPAKPSKAARPASPKAASAKKKGTAATKSSTTSKAPDAEVPVAVPIEDAKPAAEKTVPSAETAAPVAPAGSDIPSATAGEVKPKKAPTKRPPRSAAKSTDAKTAFADPVEVPAPATELASEVPAKATPKRRGKLGLFGKGQGADEAASAEKEAIANAVEPTPDQAKSAKPAKVTKPKRMARNPKSSDTKTD